jgi:Uncharacterized protein conserved in bacteria
MSFDLNKLMEQAASCRSCRKRPRRRRRRRRPAVGWSPVTASAGGQILELKIDPKAIDPEDPELLADLVMAATNEALRAAQAKVEAKMKSMLPPDLGGLLG